MELEPAGSAQVDVTVKTPAVVYDLRLYNSPEFVVPAWWLGIFDVEPPELRHTEVFHRTEPAAPGEVFRWLLPIVGQEIAGRLVSSVAEDLASSRCQFPAPVRKPFVTRPAEDE
jgi:hypothetical protein